MTKYLFFELLPLLFKGGHAIYVDFLGGSARVYLLVICTARGYIGSGGGWGFMGCNSSSPHPIYGSSPLRQGLTYVHGSCMVQTYLKAGGKGRQPRGMKTTK